MLQPEFATASAIVFVVGPLLESLGEMGDHGHRVLLTRAGTACEAAWLKSLQFGLVGSIFAGFLPAAARDFFGIDGLRDSQLLAYAVGHPR